MGTTPLPLHGPPRHATVGTPDGAGDVGGVDPEVTQQQGPVPWRDRPLRWS
jgi:hypothetical protein